MNVLERLVSPPTSTTWAVFEAELLGQQLGAGGIGPSPHRRGRHPHLEGGAVAADDGRTARARLHVDMEVDGVVAFGGEEIVDVHRRSRLLVLAVLYGPGVVTNPGAVEARANV